VVTDDEVRSLAISQRLLGTREIVLIPHTDQVRGFIFRRGYRAAQRGRLTHPRDR
jgi:hypothetical protein